MSDTPSFTGVPNGGASPDDRLAQLLADDVVFGLTSDEQLELDERLSGSDAASEVDAYGRAAAAFYLATAPVDIEPMPEHLRAAVLGQAPGKQASGKSAAEQPVVERAADPLYPPTKRDVSLWWPLSVAASLLLGAALGGLLPDGPQDGDAVVGPPIAKSAAKQRAELIASSAPLTRVAWTSTDPDADITGDVVWSDADQRGFMTFRGLAANDPTVEQYQLWVFDKNRSADHPVDGGVFDIPAGGGDIVVPIDAKITVDQAVMFAITIERPGGVVVSDRSRLPLLAKVP